ncbi:MAG: SusE domain-containing protein, partial [Chitinophagaceae bacterium]
MKNFIKILLLSVVVMVIYTACDKVDSLPSYNNGSAPVLGASATAVAAPAADSNKVVLTLSWSFPGYATDSANMKYVVEIDSAGKNFAKADSKTILKSLSTNFTAKELNNILLAKGYAFNVPVDMDVRVISSYANNNERLISNTLKIRMTPYKIPPKVPLPTTGRLFIVGDATTFGWSNDAAPAFPPDREFARLDETTWGAVMYLDGSGAYKFLQTQGNWDTQFHMVNGGTA